MHFYVLKPENWIHILGAIDNSQKESERPITPLWKYYSARVEDYARGALGEKAFESAFTEGRKMSLDEALDRAFKIIEEM